MRLVYTLYLVKGSEGKEITQKTCLIFQASLKSAKVLKKSEFI